MLLRADTTANEYMQELPEIVQEMVGFRLPHARERSRAKTRCWRFATRSNKAHRL